MKKRDIFKLELVCLAITKSGATTRPMGSMTVYEAQEWIKEVLESKNYPEGVTTIVLTVLDEREKELCLR